MESPKATAISAAECRRSVAETLRAPRSLDTLLLGWPFPDRALERIRQSLPGVDVVLATESELIEKIPNADAAVSWQLSDGELDAAIRLGWFQSIGAGVERLQLEKFRDRGVIVTNTSGMHASNIAEHVLAMMLAFARRLPRVIRAQERAEWIDDFRGEIFELGGQTLHVVGYGEIGRRLAHNARALGMRVTATRRQPGTLGDGIADDISGIDRLTEHIAVADHVAICLPQTSSTVGLFDAAMIGHMKQGAYIYNIGRGPIIDSNAMIGALTSGHLAGAGLDVTDPEPLPADSPLWQMPNVIITAHTAGSTPHFISRLTDIVIDNARRYRDGEPLRNVVDVEQGY
jgi:phosphoglycerate dehydrogenase-like enzyme